MFAQNQFFVGRRIHDLLQGEWNVFLPRCRISKVHWYLTGILVHLYEFRLEVDFVNSSFCLQSFDLIFWNYIDLSTRVVFVADVYPVGFDYDWPLCLCLFGHYVNLFVVVFNLIQNYKNDANKKLFSSKICSGYPYKFFSRYENVGKVLFFMTGIAHLIQCRARSFHVSSTILFILFNYLYFRLKIPIFLFAILYSVNLCILFQVSSVTFSFADFPNAIAFSRVKFGSLSFLSLNKSSISPIIIMFITREFF